MFQLNFGDHRPLYEQIKDKIKELISCGALAEETKIPSVRELAVSLAINPNTIQKAYRELESEGYIYSIRAKGSFVAPKNNIKVQKNSESDILELQKVIYQLKFSGMSNSEIQEIVNKTLEEGKAND